MHKERFGHLEDKLREDKFIVLKSSLQWLEAIPTVANKSSKGAVFFCTANYWTVIETKYG
jgi:hypothetical protein